MPEHICKSLGCGLTVSSDLALSRHKLIIHRSIKCRNAAHLPWKDLDGYSGYSRIMQSLENELGVAAGVRYDLRCGCKVVSGPLGEESCVPLEVD